MSEQEKTAAESVDDLLRKYEGLTDYQETERLRELLDYISLTRENPFWRKLNRPEADIQRLRPAIFENDFRSWLGTRRLSRWFSADATANPLLAAGLAIEEEAGIDRTKEILVQGTLAYIGGADIDYPVDRYLPVDIHLPDWEPEKVADISVALRALCESIGCQYIEYPALAKSSTHARGVLRTPKKTAEEFELFQMGLSLLWDGLEQSEAAEKLLSGQAADTDLVMLHAELLKLNAETKKTDAERRKVEAEIEHANVEEDKTKAEIKKIEEETKKTRAEKFNIFATALMKIVAALSLGASIVIGGSELGAKFTQKEGAETATVIVVKKEVTKAKHASKLKEFLKTLGEMEETVTKTTGE